ncbi:MAG: hypothetical protein LBF32_01920 [Streptococcaceae bacterium]|jgi:hypothetical protein|nr:hypothetical protein [Streptococcaceae bacterium]
MKKKIIFSIVLTFMLVTVSYFSCINVQGMTVQLENSLFLPNEHWLVQKIVQRLDGKKYTNFFQEAQLCSQIFNI